MYLIDTNMVIYFLDKNPEVQEFLNDLLQPRFYMSIVSRLELMVGAEKNGLSLDEMRDFLSDIVQYPLDEQVVDQATEMYLNSNKKLKFKDLIIAATAKLHKKTLITADKDFQDLDGVDVKLFGG